MRYYNLSGGYGTHEIQQLFDIYGVTFTPHTFFNGITNIMGGGVLISTGGPYMEIVEDKYFEVSPIKLHINYFDPVTGETSVTATMIAPDVEIIDATIRFAMIEDNLDGTYQHVTRDIMKFDFDLSGQGNTFTTIENFEMADNYITSNLNAVVYVQTPELDIIQSVSSYDIPDYKVRALVPFEMDHFDPDYDPEGAYTYEGEFFSIINYGLEDDLTIDLVIDDAPDGWTMSFCDDVNCYLSTADFSLPQDGYDQFHVNVMPTSIGSAEYHFEITSDNAEYTYNIPFVYSNYETNISEDVVSGIPQIQLHQNYPNPFGSSTTFSYQISSENAENTEISIYNTKGQKVRTFPNQQIDGSTDQMIIWDGTDDNNRPVSNGIYFYKLQTGKYVTAKKMIRME